MTAEVQVRLSEIREAAERMRRASERLTLSTDSISDCITFLQTHGVDLYFLRLAAQYRPADLHAQLQRYADNLDNTANEIESYLLLQDYTDKPKVWFVGASVMLNGAPPVATTRADDDQEPQAKPHHLRDYVAASNRALFDKLAEKETLLNDQQQKLDDLRESRQQLSTDLESLKDRLRSFNPSADLTSIPRVQIMEQQLAQTDAQIASAETELGALQKDVIDLQVRLERVKPGAGADLTLVAQMENGVTADIIKANTFDCVKYVVHKLPVPEVIARDAYLWDDAVLKHPEYGITVGSTPLEGSVLLMEREHPYADDLAGHIMYVERVENGEVWITDNTHPEPVRLSDLTTELSSIKYLYFPWHTKA